jgi:hypothetical protein
MAERSGAFLLQGGDSLVAMEPGQFASEWRREKNRDQTFSAKPTWEPAGCLTQGPLLPLEADINTTGRRVR